MNGVFVYREPAKIVQDILQSELSLSDGQVMFTNQKYLIPTNGLFIVVSYIGPSKVMSCADEWVDDGFGGLTEIQSVVLFHTLQIDIMSYDDSARVRKEEIAMALRSLFSESQQELYCMQIARQPGAFTDTSFLEDTKMMTRYTTTVATSSVNRKQKPVGDFYTDFTRAVPPKVVVNA